MYADLNQGIVSMLFSFTSVFLLIASYLIFHEKSNIYHITGMLCLIASAIIIGFSGVKNKTIMIEGEEYDIVSKFVPIGFSILTTLYFCFRSLTIKAYRIKLKFTVLELMSYSMIIHGIFFVVIWGINIYKEGIDPTFLRNSLLGGFFQAWGGFCSFYATSHGYSGPASALVNTQSIIQLALIWIFLQRLPNSLELIGFILGIFGSFVMAVGKDSINLLVCKFNRKGKN